MKYIKWKSFITTSLVCLLPIALGLILWNKLPDKIAIHFNINNEPDNYASKGFAVFALPFMMTLLQIFCCIVNDINSYKHGERKKFEAVTKWIMPVMCIILQAFTFAYALGININPRLVAALIVGTILLIIGNYMPKFDYIKNYNLNTQKARKINRFIGYETVIMGVLMLLTIVLPPITTLIWLILMIPYIIVSIVYSIIIARKD